MPVSRQQQLHDESGASNKQLGGGGDLIYLILPTFYFQS